MQIVRSLKSTSQASVTQKISVTRLKLWSQRNRTRKQLFVLLERDPDRLINDLGLTLEAVRAEVRKPFWIE